MCLNNISKGDGKMDKIKALDVFNCRNVFPKPFHECVEIAKSVGYSYMSFNTMVVSVDADSTSDYICLEEDLIV